MAAKRVSFVLLDARTERSKENILLPSAVAGSSTWAKVSARRGLRMSPMLLLVLAEAETVWGQKGP
eukprot:9725086-Alexandrium_andersonii.AAC.1